MLVVAVSGFASLGLEIVWFRLMLQFVVATTEAFTAMLTTVLGGIALGGMLAAVILRSRRDLSTILGIVQATTGVAAVGSMSFLLWTVTARLGNDGAVARGGDRDPAAVVVPWASAFRSRSAWRRDRWT